MQIGASTLYDVTAQPAALARSLASRGFRAIEIVFEHPQFLDASDVAALRKLKREYDLSYSVHCPYMSMMVGHRDAAIRRASDALLARSIRAASALEATHYVMHGGRMPFYYSAADFQRKFSRAAVLRDWIAEFKPLARLAAEGGVRVVFENCLRSDFFGKAETHFAAARACGAGVCLDVAHAELTRQRAAYSRRGFKPDYVHVTDTRVSEKFDAHLGVGEGEIDFAWWMKKLRGNGFNGKMILECIRASDFAPSRKELLRLWNK
jgi:sugar phosphate isomerase/epimerase